MKTFDNTRPVVAAMAFGVARAALERTREILDAAGALAGDERPVARDDAEAELASLEAELEAARLLTLKAAWMADNRVPNSLEASMAKAKAARVVNEVTLRCVELSACGTTRASCSRSGRATPRSSTSSRVRSRSRCSSSRGAAREDERRAPLDADGEKRRR